MAIEHSSPPLCACGAVRHCQATRCLACEKRRRLAANLTCEHIDPIAVFNRDRWRCQLCGCSTPKRLRGQMVDRAPELDHIVPLGSGGAHTWVNVHCACRKCNGQKHANPLGQLRLS